MRAAVRVLNIAHPPLRNALCVLFLAVLGRVRSFLPQLAAAEGEVVDIEDVSEDEPHIEMVGSLIVMRSLYFCMCRFMCESMPR